MINKKEIIKKFEEWMMARDSDKLVSIHEVREYYAEHLRYRGGIGIVEFVDLIRDSVNAFNEQIQN